MLAGGGEKRRPMHMWCPRDIYAHSRHDDVFCAKASSLGTMCGVRGGATGRLGDFVIWKCSLLPVARSMAHSRRVTAFWSFPNTWQGRNCSLLSPPSLGPSPPSGSSCALKRAGATYDAHRGTLSESWDETAPGVRCMPRGM